MINAKKCHGIYNEDYPVEKYITIKSQDFYYP